MAVEASLRNSLYKIELYLVKIIPVCTALIILLNTVLSFWLGMDTPILSYIGGVSIFTIVFFYLSSYVFRFCVYHRMVIHYIALNWIINIYDYYIGIPLDDRELFALYMIIAGIFLFLILFLHQKEVRRKRQSTN